MSKEIPLTQGYVAIVDDEDYDELAQYKWYLQRMRGGYKARRALPRDEHGKRPQLYMHRVILGAKHGVCVDHLNHDTLDNRRSNLRLCSYSQNNANRHSYKGLPYKGVSLTPGGKWRARIKANKQELFLGSFDTPDEAAIAYNVAAREYFGEFALLNEV